MTDEPLGFTRDEILSSLPTGWVLPEGETGRHTHRGDCRITVLDLADQKWELNVEAGQAIQLGRIEALRRAFERLQRRALGRAGLFG